MHLLLYVDDIIIAGPDLNNIEDCKRYLQKEFEIKDVGNLRYFLGLEIDYNREKGILKLHQGRYLEKILKKFKLDNCHPCLTPIEAKLNIRVENEAEDHKPIREMIGALMYLMLGSRLDISYALKFLSRFQNKNSIEVWVHLKRLLRYLKGTKGTKLVYIRNEEAIPLTCYVDSDWAQDTKDRKSVTGYLIKVFGNTVSWVTRKQNCVALSSTEAELVALCAGVQEGIWYRKLLKDMHLEVPNFKVFEDNQSCIALVRNPENNRRVKHIDIKLNFVSDILKDKIVTIEYVKTELQLADILTKGLNSIKFYSNFEEIGLELREGKLSNGL